MCDYSLAQHESRTAAAGDRLVTCRFPGSSTVGFAAQDEPEVAVCLQPGTGIAFTEPVSFSGLVRFLLQGSSCDALAARLRRVNEDDPLLHHDALEFGNGHVVLLTDLCPGQRAVITQLPTGTADFFKEPVCT